MDLLSAGHTRSTVPIGCGCAAAAAAPSTAAFHLRYYDEYLQQQPGLHHHHQHHNIRQQHLNVGSSHSARRPISTTENKLHHHQHHVNNTTIVNDFSPTTGTIGTTGSIGTTGATIGTGSEIYNSAPYSLENNYNLPVLPTTSIMPVPSPPVQEVSLTRAPYSYPAPSASSALIRVGDIVPNAAINLRGSHVHLVKQFQSGNGIIFGFVGAFETHDTECRMKALQENLDEYTRLAEFIGAVSVNDPFVVRAWARKLNADSRITFIADSDLQFTKAIGMAQYFPCEGLGWRSRRYALVVGRGSRVRYVAVDDMAKPDLLIKEIPIYLRSPWKSFLVGVEYHHHQPSKGGKVVSRKSKRVLQGGDEVKEAMGTVRTLLSNSEGFCDGSDWQLCFYEENREKRKEGGHDHHHRHHQHHHSRHHHHTADSCKNSSSTCTSSTSSASSISSSSPSINGGNNHYQNNTTTHSSPHPHNSNNNNNQQHQHHRHHHPQNKTYTPTKENIKSGLKWLVEGCQPGDALVLYFCGKLNDTGSALLPCDYKTEGGIEWTWIQDNIIATLPDYVRLTIIIDSVRRDTSSNNTSSRKQKFGAYHKFETSLVTRNDHQYAATQSQMYGEPGGTATTTLGTNTPHSPKADFVAIISDVVIKEPSRKIRQNLQGIGARALHQALLKHPAGSTDNHHHRQQPWQPQRSILGNGVPSFAQLLESFRREVEQEISTVSGKEFTVNARYASNIEILLEEQFSIGDALPRIFI